MAALLSSVGFEGDGMAGLDPGQACALARMSGSGARVWFSGSQVEAKAKERWIEHARGAWIKEVADRAAAASAAPAEGDSLGSLADLQSFKAAAALPGSLAAEFSEAFPGLVKGVEAHGQRMALCVLAMGCSLGEIRSLASGARQRKQGAAVAGSASAGQAAEELARIKAQREWRPTRGEDLAGAGGFAGSALTWAAVEKLGAEIVEEHGLGWLSIDDSLPIKEAARALSNIKASMELLERETGLGPKSAGLGGWGLRVGEYLGSAAGQCHAGARCITLARWGGDGSFAHEWLHALDRELGAAAGAGGLLSESAQVKGGLGQAMEGLLGAAMSPSEEVFAGLGDPLKAYAAACLDSSSVRAGLTGGQKEVFEGRWMEAARAMFEAGDGVGEQAGFERLKSVYRSARPELGDGDFNGLWSGFLLAKRPDAGFLEKMAEASDKSAFYQSAVLMDLIEGKNYRAKPCEMLSRAFESSFALPAARELLGPGAAGKQVSMVSNDGDGDADIPQGAERARCRPRSRFFLRKWPRRCRVLRIRRLGGAGLPPGRIRRIRPSFSKSSGLGGWPRLPHWFARLRLEVDSGSLPDSIFAWSLRVCVDSIFFRARWYDRCSMDKRAMLAGVRTFDDGVDGLDKMLFKALGNGDGEAACGGGVWRRCGCGC